jgi:hypothetical protein
MYICEDERVAGQSGRRGWGCVLRCFGCIYLTYTLFRMSFFCSFELDLGLGIGGIEMDVYR